MAYAAELKAALDARDWPATNRKGVGAEPRSSTLSHGPLFELARKSALVAGMPLRNRLQINCMELGLWDELPIHKDGNQGSSAGLALGDYDQGELR